MTLIAIRADKDSARVMTDSWGYTFGLTINHTSKQTSVPHLDAAIVAQGSTTFQALWLAHGHELAGEVATFDEFLAATPERLRTVWTRLTGRVRAENDADGARAEVANSTIFHVGYSTARRSFVAVAFASEHDFASIDLGTSLYVQPTPLNLPPGPVEAGRLERSFARAGLDRRPLEQLAAQPAPRSVGPVDVKEWVALARRVRADRSECDLWSGFKTYVGGDVHLTSLSRGQATTRRIHRFADSADTLRRIFAGSLHPIAQAGPCPCESGRRYVDCCLGANYDGRHCPCGSPANFEECCSIASHAVAAS